jgi:hypothetical protein
MLWLRLSARVPTLARLSFGPLAAALLTAGCAGSLSSEAARMETRSVLEAAGLPGQVHPAADIRQLADDPSEPFSARYGSAPAPLLARGATPAASFDAEAIIAAAITAHEMRKP